ncbi:tape measure protein [Pseudomonas triclosanedens]|uniref:tape measure protein n=1 Tax=Pseudomonas triclosanedens TaxID=2961893 RepID=UPI0020C2DD6E|nr:tape measure protein [Pseudomonas triclosanedens]MCP8470871.1 tape measure protein [Pseudomonas triclosanedens]
MANNQQLTLALRIRAEMRDAQNALRRLEGEVDQLGDSTRTTARDADQLTAATQRIGGGMNALTASIRAAAVGLTAFFGVREIIQATDAWTNLQNRLRLITSDSAALAIATGDVYRIAQLTSSELDSTATVYQRFGQNADRLGISQKQVASLTETVAKAIAISGVNAASAEASLTQFGQAIGSGVLRGDEFNSVAEQTPALMKAIADGLGVTTTELRNMAAAGELTADVLVDALTSAAGSVNDQFATRIKTASAAIQELENSFTRLVGEFTNGQGAGEALAGAISGVASVLDGLSDNAELLGTALDAVMVTAAGRAVAAITDLTSKKLSDAAASKAAAVAAAQKATADEGVAVAAQRAAALELQRAKAAVASAESEVAASRARQAAALQNLRDVQAALVAERGLEQARLQAQITDVGRQQSIARLAELRLAEAAIIKQVQAAEAALASTTVASSAAATAAYQRRTAAVAAAATTQQALTVATNNANVASAAAATASSLLARGLGTVTAVGGRLLAFLGGPIGVISMIAIAATAFIDFGGDAEAGMDRAANATETASVRIRNATRNIIQSLNLGDLKTANYDQIGQSIEQIKRQLAEAEQVQQRAEALQDSDVPAVPGMDLPSLDEANEKVQALTGALRQLEAQQGSDRFKNVREGNKYLENLERQNERLQNLSATEEAMNYLRKEGIDATSALGKRILEQASANQKLDAANKAEAESKREAEAAARKGLQTSEQLRKSQESYVDQLEKQAAILGLNSAEVRAYELAEKGLTGALKARADAALAAIDADEKKRQAETNARTNADLEAEFLHASGRNVDAGLLEIRAKFDAMRQDFEKSGNDAGLAWIDKLVPVAEAKVRLDDVKQRMDDLLAEQQRTEASVNVQQDSGVINEMDARQRILDIHRATFEKLQQIRPVLEQMARQPGEVGRAAAQALAELDGEAQRLQATTTLLQTTLRDGLTTGFTDALKGLAKGTMDLRDAIGALAEGVANALVDMASQNLAQSLSSGIMGMFGGEQQGASLTTGAAAVSGSAAQLTMAGGTLLTGASAISAAATALAAANGSQAGGAAAGAAGGMQGIADDFGAAFGLPSMAGGGAAQASADAISSASTQGAAAMGEAITSASSQGSGIFGSALSGIFSGGADMFGTLFSSLFGGLGGGAAGGAGGFSSLFGLGMAAFAGGGQVRGPGTPTSDSVPIWASDTEFVTRGAVVRQPGALGFLHDFNARGMQALTEWAWRMAPRHSTGGPVGMPAPVLPAPIGGGATLPEPAASMSATLKNSQNFYLVDDENRIQDLAYSDAGIEKMLVRISRDPARFRSAIRLE